ncbi:MAG: RsmD family RNA methyltransferase, partial [Candidatus Rokuibacteriota bacterium]
GALGIEALSRGAARAVFAERDRAALQALRKNLAALRLPRDRARVVAGDVLAALPALAGSESPFDLVFLDPPYVGDAAARALVALAGSPLVPHGTRIVVQHAARRAPPVPPGLVPAREPRRFGETTLTFLRAERYTPGGSEDR